VWEVCWESLQSLYKVGQRDARISGVSGSVCDGGKKGGWTVGKREVKERENPIIGQGWITWGDFPVLKDSRTSKRRVKEGATSRQLYW